MSEALICGHCSYMRPTDGHCTYHDRDVCFFDEARCFEAKMPEPETKERKKRVSKNPPGTWTAARRLSADKAREEKAKRTHKVCPTCKRMLPIDAFGKGTREADGHSCYCRECYNKKKREEKARKRGKV